MCLHGSTLGVVVSFFLTFVLTMRSLLTCEHVCIAQMDSKLTSFVAALSEISSLTELTYGPDISGSGGAGESEISSPAKSSPTDPSNGSSLTGPSNCSEGGQSAIPMADAVAVGVDSVSYKEFEVSLPSVSVVTFEEETNLCDCSECGSG